MADENTQFVVDLGKLQLTPDQKQRINASIQKAVAGELAQFNMKDQLIFIPGRGKKLLGPMLWGMIIRILGNRRVEEFI